MAEQNVYRFGNISFTAANQLIKPVDLELDIARVEAELKVQLPREYKLFILQFGAGCFDWIPLTVVHPRRIKLVTESQRETMNEHWFWENNQHGISKSYALSCFSCFESEAGDYLLFHPSNPDSTLILPHEDEDVEATSKFSELYYFCRKYTGLEDKELDLFTPHRL